VFDKQWKTLGDLALPRKAGTALAREQHRQLKGHMITLYLCLLANSLFMAIAVSPSVHPLVAWSVPSLLFTITVIRLRFWYLNKGSQDNLPIQTVKAELASSPKMTLVLSLILCFWSFGILYNADQSVRSFVALFAVLNSITCAYCIMSVPTSAHMVIGLGSFPISVGMIFTGDRLLMIMAVNMIVIGFLVVKMINAQFRQLRRIVTTNSEIKAEKSKVNRLAYRDHLTDLPNRRAFMNTLTKLEVEDAGQGLAALMIDLDGFKPINDVYGHAAGDKLLIEVAKRFRDIVGDLGLTARLGGDEFAVLLTDQANTGAAEDLAVLMSDALEDPFTIEGHQVRVQASFGIAYCDGLPADPSDILKQADIAMYEAKENHGLSVSVFQSTMEDRMRRRTIIEQALASNNKCDGITVQFQPIFDTRTLSVVGFEALARWHHPELGDISPSEFVPIAEQSGMIDRLTVHLFSEALKTAQQWPDTVTLSFNLSASELATEALVPQLVDLIVDHHVDLKRVMIEVTETALLHDFTQARRLVAELRKNGIQVALDDFGAGYASIGYLREMRFDRIKLDGSLIRPILHDGAARDLLAGVLYLAQAIGAEVVAEMIESQEQLDLLRAMPVAMVQGYYLARPMDGKKTMAYFTDELAMENFG
jgi:diguanylate cyclase (GGDEF)-like protein